MMTERRGSESRSGLIITAADSDTPCYLPWSALLFALEKYMKIVSVESVKMNTNEGFFKINTAQGCEDSYHQLS